MSLLFWIALVIICFFGFVVFRGAPYVPTKRRPLEDAFKELYRLDASDTLVDIGSGDGVVLRAAALRGARAVGYELNPVLVILSQLLSRNPLITIYFADYWNATFPEDTTIIYTFGDSRDIKKMYRKAEQTALLYEKEIYFMSFGIKVPGKKPTKKNDLFFLYRIKPL